MDKVVVLIKVAILIAAIIIIYTALINYIMNLCQDNKTDINNKDTIVSNKGII